MIKTAAIKANITQKNTLHTLRHRFVAHGLEAGVGWQQIQIVLDHSSSKATEIYTHNSD